MSFPFSTTNSTVSLKNNKNLRGNPNIYKNRKAYYRAAKNLKINHITSSQEELLLIREKYKKIKRAKAWLDVLYVVVSFGILYLIYYYATK
jgi:hypothetical protein